MANVAGRRARSVRRCPWWWRCANAASDLELPSDTRQPQPPSGIRMPRYLPVHPVKAQFTSCWLDVHISSVSRVTKSSFFCDKTSHHQLVRCRLAAKWGVRNRGDASSVSRTGAPHQIQRAKRTLTVAESGARRNRTRNNIKHNVGRIHTYLEVLVLIDLCSVDCDKGSRLAGEVHDVERRA